jgi:hypothetical protein
MPRDVGYYCHWIMTCRQRGFIEEPVGGGHVA